jgi:hypothetical protein
MANHCRNGIHCQTHACICRCDGCKGTGAAKLTCSSCNRPLIGGACPEVVFQHDKALIERDDRMRSANNAAGAYLEANDDGHRCASGGDQCTACELRYALSQL